jgi:hypothetical protein
MTTAPLPVNTQLSPFRSTALCHPTRDVTGTEQAVAGIFGFLTAGPAGYMASIATIRGTKGSWFPWFALGIVAAPVLFWTQVIVLAGVVNTMSNASTSIQRSR